jgi:hypothetical protein
LRREKLEESEHENGKERISRDATPTIEAQTPALNLSKNNRERSVTPENDRNNYDARENVDNQSVDVDDASVGSQSSKSPSPPPELNAKMNFQDEFDFPKPPPSIAFPSTEILLRNIQELVKVVLENSIRHQQQINFEKGKNNSKILLRHKFQFSYQFIKPSSR